MCDDLLAEKSIILRASFQAAIMANNHTSRNVGCRHGAVSSFKPSWATSSCNASHQNPSQGLAAPPSLSGSKRKLIRMNDEQCLSHSMTSSGARALTDPDPQGLAKRPNMDVNRGLYPRQPQARTHATFPVSQGSHPAAGSSQKASSPMKQSSITSFFPRSPSKKFLPHSQSSSSQVGIFNHAPSQASSSPRMRTHSTSKSSPCRNINFNRPTNSPQKTPTKSPSSTSRNSPWKGMTKFGVTYDPRNQAAIPARSPIQCGSKQSMDHIKAFEEDDTITVAMFDDIVGSCKETQSIKHLPGTSIDAEKEFEDDDLFTVEEFDDVLRSSQGSANAKEETDKLESPGDSSGAQRCNEGALSCQSSANSNPKPKKSSSLEEDFENDDLFTADEFDEVMRSSQSPVKSKPLPSESGKTHHSPSHQSAGLTSTPPCTFGLLGEGTPLSPDHKSKGSIADDFFGGLPDEVLENILGQLPIQDTCLTASMVCKRWNRIISGDRFVPWKKRYHQLKKLQGADEKKAVEDVFNVDGQLKSRSCLVQMIKCVSRQRVSLSDAALDGLKLHPKYQAALHVLREKAPEVFTKEEPHSWSVVAAIVILSETPQEVCKITDCLLARQQPVPRTWVSECLYCIASALFLFQMKFGINRGLHYRVYNALHKLESGDFGDNEELTETAKESGSGQQSLLRYGQRQGIRLTPEQMRIINHKLCPRDVIKIIAFAGTGKTTTLVRFAQLRPNLNFLYIAFNKTVQEQASLKFPRNVECRTLHSLAFRAVGFRYRSKLGFSLKPFFIQHHLPANEDTGLHHMTLAKCVCTTIEHFVASDDPFMTTVHTPVWNTTRTPRTEFNHRTRMAIARAAEAVFAALCDVNNTDARITHDIYLKLYEMQKPQLHGYDCLLIDEAQDLTPAQQSILLNQSCAKILVGDPHQQIYSFRGATNTMARVEATRIYQLTQSFRFGPEIAYVSSLLLDVLKQHTKSTIIGSGPKGDVLGQPVGRVATICRSNEVVFREAIKMVTQNNKAKIEFCGGVRGYGFDKIVDIYYLSLPPKERGTYKAKDKFIARFKSLADLQSYAQRADDVDLESRIKLVLRYHSRIPALVDKIQRCAVVGSGDAILTTAHKSKGLEFDTVQLTDDFIQDIVDVSGNVMPEDEKNILYVAVTRAKKSLILNHTLYHFLKKAKECFEYPALAREVRVQAGPPKCQECEVVQDNPKQLLLLKRSNINLVYPVKQGASRAGYVCSRCVDAPGFEELYGKPSLEDEVERVDRGWEEDGRARIIVGISFGVL